MQGQSIEHLDVPPASLRGNISSVMSDISGDITSVHPAKRRAGVGMLVICLRSCTNPRNLLISCSYSCIRASFSAILASICRVFWRVVSLAYDVGCLEVEGSDGLEVDVSVKVSRKAGIFEGHLLVIMIEKRKMGSQKDAHRRTRRSHHSHHHRSPY